MNNMSIGIISWQRSEQGVKGVYSRVLKGLTFLSTPANLRNVLASCPALVVFQPAPHALPIAPDPHGFLPNLHLSLRV